MGFMDNFAKPQGMMGRMVARGMNIGHALISEWALSFVDFAGIACALDVGCGGGGNIRRMLKAHPGLRVDGLDYSPDCVDLSRRANKGELGRRCEIALGSVDDMPYADGSYDLVTAIETIYFWPDLPKALGEIRRVLKSGGRLVVCCELGSIEQAEKYTEQISGMRVYPADEVARMSREAGFEDVSSHAEGDAKYCVVAARS